MDSIFIYYFQDSADTTNLNGSYELYDNLILTIGSATSSYSGLFSINEFSIFQGALIIDKPFVNTNL